MIKISIFLFGFIASTLANNSDIQKNVNLPKLFDSKDAELCPENKYICKVHIKLRPADVNNTSYTWKKIEEVSKDLSNFDRSWLFRGYCLEDNENIQDLDVAERENLDSNGLVPSIEYYSCSKKRGFFEKLDCYDIFVTLSYISYFIFVAYCLFKTYQYTKSNPEDYYLDKMNTFVKFFSGLYSWRRMKKGESNEDFKKLLAMQGIRNFLTLILLIVHTYEALGHLFIENPEILENMTKLPGIFSFLGLAPVAVEVYFVISAWLMSLQLCNIVKMNGTVTFKDICIMALNRYFRLMPVIFFINLLHGTNYGSNGVSPLYSGLFRDEKNRCRGDNWWIDYVFIQNWPIFNGNACNIGTWSIAADTQLYVLMLLLFYLHQKFKIPFKHILGVTASIFLSLQLYFVLSKNFDPVLRFDVRLYPHENSINHPVFVWSYIPTYSHFGSYAIGFIFGMIYFKRKRENIFNTKAKKIFWALSFLGLPAVLSKCFIQYRHSYLLNIFYAITFRPLLSLGFAIGILGMATNTGGIVKRFLESEIFVNLAYFNYSIYIVHFSITFSRSFFDNSTILLNYPYMLYIFTTNTLLSILLGSLMFLFLEHPCVLLQKILLPQVKPVDTIKKK